MIDNYNDNSDLDSDTEISNEEKKNKIKENELLNNLKYDYQQFEIKDFYDCYLIKEKKINLKPIYQRSFSWNQSKQDLFIDSIINNYIIPPIILIKLEGEDYEYECIDGQHRLCVIKHFIESKPIDPEKSHYIRYHRIEGDKIYNVLYDDKENINKYIRNKSYFTQEEKKKFNNRTITILKISNYDIKNKNGMDRLKKNMFLRLQNGERVSSVDKFKNIDRPIINALNFYGLLNYDTYKNDNSVWNKILSILDIPLKQKNSNTSKIKFLHIFLIVCLLLIHEKSFDIGSYMDMNILKYIEDEHSVFKKDISTDIWKNCIEKFKFFIIDFYEYIIKQTHKYLDKNIIYVILFQYINDKNKYDIYITNVIDIISIYNNNKDFKYKEQHNKQIDYTDFKNFVSEIDEKIKYINLNYNIADNKYSNSNIKIEKPIIKNNEISKKNREILSDYYNKNNNNPKYEDYMKTIKKNISNNKELTENDIRKVIYEYNNKKGILADTLDNFINKFEEMYQIDEDILSNIDDIKCIIEQINIENKLVIESFDIRKFIDKFKNFIGFKENLSNIYVDILMEYYNNKINKNNNTNTNKNIVDESPKKKQSVAKVLKDNVWNKYIGIKIGQTNCLCCKTNKISQSNFHCGHFISESKGGKTDIDNLRPICSNCNLSMGAQNMDKFMEKCGFNK